MGLGLAHNGAAMSGSNVTIHQLPTQSAIVAGDSLPAWSATGSSTYQAFATQVSAFVFSTTMVMTGQSTATIATAGAVTLASGPVGYLIVSLNGTAVKFPYYSA